MKSNYNILAASIPVFVAVCLAVELYFAQAHDGWIFRPSDSTGWLITLRLIEGPFGAYLALLFAVCGGLIAALLPHSWLGYLMIVVPSVACFTFRSVLTLFAAECAVSDASSLSVSRCALGYSWKVASTILTNEPFLALVTLIIVAYWGPRLIVDWMIAPDFGGTRSRFFTVSPGHRLRIEWLERYVIQAGNWWRAGTKAISTAVTRARWCAGALMLLWTYSFVVLWIHFKVPEETFRYVFLFSIAVLSIVTYIIAAAVHGRALPPHATRSEWGFYLVVAVLPFISAIAYRETLFITTRIPLEYGFISPLSYPFWALITVSGGFLLRSLLDAAAKKAFPI